MKVLIIYNAEKKNAYSVANSASEILRSYGATAEVAEFSFENKLTDSEAEKIAAVDAVAVVGGDGTILKVAKTAALLDRPVLGINAGRLGYLASVDCDKLEILGKLISGDYTVENRYMIKAEKFVSGVCVDRCHCLNDAVISKDALSNVIDIELTMGHDTVKYRADGIIASTPTGSTAYSLSAGGPVVDPTLKCMILTPVCPHTLVTRSVVLNSDTSVTVSVSGSNDTDVYLSCDGRKAFELEQGSVVSIGTSGRFAKFIKLNDVSVYKVFSEKINGY